MTSAAATNRTGGARTGGGRPAVAATIMLSAVALVSACGSATPNSAGGQGPASATSSVTPSNSPASQSTGPGGAGCATSALKAVVDTSQSGAAAGSVYYPIDLTNTSSATCTLFGYPGVSFVTGPSGTQIGQAASRNPVAAASTVTLAPGAVAHATLQVAQAGNYDASKCRPVTAHWLRIFPPGQVTPLYPRFTTTVCSRQLPRDVGRQLSISAVRPGAGRAGQGP